MKNTYSMIAGVMLTFATVGAAYADGGGHNPAQVFPNPPTQSPRAPSTTADAHHNDGGQDRSGRDWTKDVTPHTHEHPANAPSYPSLQEWGWKSK